MLDWAHLQSFVAVAEQGSLSAAARVQKSSQPTLTRHIALLERALGTRLFDRTKSGVTLTQAGTDLMLHAADMADAAARVSMAQQGLEAGTAPAMEGTVRLTASRIVATYLLPDILTRLHQKWHLIELELVASDETNNLLRREADIALRMYRPTQNDVITQHVCTLDLAAYATPDYLDRHGAIAEVTDLHDHSVIGFDRSTLIIDGIGERGLNVDRNFFKFRSDDQVVCWQMVRAGFGIGFNQTFIGDEDPKVVRVFETEPIGDIPIWLTAHPELHHSPRIRRVYDFIRDALKDMTRSR
ncbi:MAG: LysR family transcriptional regulator [Sulfitobacter sp.]